MRAQEQRLEHREQAEAFHRALAGTGQKVRVGMSQLGTYPPRRFAETWGGNQLDRLADWVRGHRE